MIKCFQTWKKMTTYNLFPIIRSSGEPLARILSTNKNISSAFELYISYDFKADEIKNEIDEYNHMAYWHNLGYAKAVYLPEFDKFMFSSCPIDGC